MKMIQQMIISMQQQEIDQDDDHAVNLRAYVALWQCLLQLSNNINKQ